MKRGIEKGAFVHVIKRGGRGLPIVESIDDRWRFLRSLRYLNDSGKNENWTRDVTFAGAKGYYMPWPNDWSAQDPLVAIHAYTLLDNHFHLLLEEIREGGIARFVRSISDSMTKYFNEKHNDVGSIFQGTYRSRIIDSDEYFRRVVVYILIKNTFELYPGGFEVAVKNFNDAFGWAMAHPFCNLADLMEERKTNITAGDKTVLSLFNNDPMNFKNTAKEMVVDMYNKKQFQKGSSDFLEW